MTKYKQIFLGQNGHNLNEGFPDNFSVYFDWVVLPMDMNIPPLIRKKTDNPKTVYVKTDYLKPFLDNILKKIPGDFILITGASDFSPQVSWRNYHFNEYYKKIIENPHLKLWYTNNLRFKEDKIFSLPCGIGAGKYWDGCTAEEVDNLILEIRDHSLKLNKIEDKVFCSFREAFFNVCGDDMLIRPGIMQIVNSHIDLFDIYEPDNKPSKESFIKFLKNLTKYKYALCPHGNGMDPSPTAWLALAMGVIPVIYKTPNVVDMFDGTNSVIFFENFPEISDKNLYQDREPINFEFLTCEYWANKIKSKI